MRIFLDDEREPEFINETNTTVKVVRDYQAFVDAVDGALLGGTEISFVSFDHNLGIVDALEHNGLDCAKYLCEMDMSCEGALLSNDFRYHVHSMNPVGAENIRAYMFSYMEWKNNNDT